MHQENPKEKPKPGKKAKELEHPPATSALDECRKNFKAELRQLAVALSAATEPSDVQRQRSRMRKLLTDLRRSAIAFTSRAESPAACAGSAGSLPATRSPPPPPSTKAKAKAPSSVSVAAAAGGSSGGAALAPERSLDLATAALFAEDCVAAAALLAARGMHEEVVEIVFDMLDRDLRHTLRDAAANASQEAAQTQMQMQMPPSGNNAASTVTAAPITTMGRRARVRLLDTATERGNAVLVQAQRVLAQYEVQRNASQFYLALQAGGVEDESGKALLGSMSHIEVVCAQVTALAGADADDSYHIIFNCTVTLYEMCLHLTRRAETLGKNMQGVLEEVLSTVTRSVALCIEMCESATLKLSIVRYLPWRLRLYEFVASCYERQGLFAEALTIAQRAAQKAWELVDLEFLDSVLPPQVSRDTMQLAIDQAMLNVLRYTWYVNNVLGQTTEKSTGAAASTHAASSGAQGAKTPPPHSPSPVAVPLSQRIPSFSLSEMPRNEFDMVDRAWQLLLRTELPRRPARSIPTSGQSNDEANSAKAQAVRDASERAAVAERARGPLIHFLLALATAPPMTATATPVTTPMMSNKRSEVFSRTAVPRSATLRPLHLWATSALEHLVHHAVHRHVIANPALAASGLAEEFLQEELAPPPLPPLDPALEVTTSSNKKGANASVSPRRANRQAAAAANAAAQAGRPIHALEDEAFLQCMTLEALLRRIAPPTLSLSKAPTSSTCEEMPDEENQLLALLLHRVLYDGRNTHLFGRLCTCTIESLKKWRNGDGRLNAGTLTLTPTASKPGTLTASTPAAAAAAATTVALSRRAVLQRMTDASIIGLRVLQRMRRVAAKEEPNLSDLAEIAEELRQLAGFYGGGANTTAGPKPAASALHGARRSLLTSVPSATSSFAVVHQRLLEEGADFLHRRVHGCALTQTDRESLAEEKEKERVEEGGKKEEQVGEEKKDVSEKDTMKDEIQKEEAEDGEPKESAYEVYHGIVRTYLEAKVSSGLTDAAGIGRLVLAYAQEVENDIYTGEETYDDTDLEKAERELRRRRSCAANAISAVQIALSCITQTLARPSSAALTTTAAMAQPTPSFTAFSGVTTMKSGTSATERSTKRVSGHTASNQLLRSSSKSSARQGRRSAERSTSADPAASTISATAPEPVESNLAGHRNELELRDTRTELTHWLIRLQWHHTAHRQRLAALRRYRADLQTLLTRQKNTRIYGVTTAKEANILRTLQREGPEKVRVSDEEKTRLLAWAHDEGDELLPALVHISLAPYQPHKKAQREMIEEALHILQRYDSRRAAVTTPFHRTPQSSAGPRGTSPLSRITARSTHEESKYSALMLWCYVTTTCGKLGFIGMAQSAKEVLYAVFAKCDTSTSVHQRTVPHGNGHDTLEEEQKKSNKDSEELYDENEVDTFAVKPNDEVLAISSPLLVRTLVSALLWISTADRQRHSYENYDLMGLVPFTGRNILLGVPFTGRYGFARTQRLYMQNAYRLQFAIELGSILQAHELMLECAFELFNALLPTLLDANYCPLVLQPLAALCMTLLRQPDSVWADTHVQLLAARTLKAVLRTAQKMEQAPLSEAQLSSQQQQAMQSSSFPPATTPTATKVGNVQAMNLSDIAAFITVPGTAAGWYDLFTRTFAHVWTRVYTHPNPRQLRHIAHTRRGAAEVHRTLSLNADASAVATPSPARSRTVSRARKSNSPREDTGGAGASGPFPCSGFASVDPLVDDCVPIELLELLDALLFVVPGGANMGLPMPRAGSPSRRATSTSKLAAPTGAGTLLGVPAWVTEVARLLANRTLAPALERLQQAADDPLYAKTAVHVVESLLRGGDVATAQRVASGALLQIQKQHDAVQQHQETVLERMKSWLQREGYIFTASASAGGASSSRGGLGASKERPSDAKGQGGNKSPTRVRKGLKGSKEGTDGGALSATSTGELGLTAATSPASLGEPRHWTLAEQQMLRQLTRGFAWLRRRRAFHWLRNRLMQFTSPYQAQLRLYLSAIGQLTIERRRHLQNEAEQQQMLTATRMNTSRGGRGRAVDAEPVTGAVGEDGGDDIEEERRSIDDAARAAVLFNRCGFPARAFAAVGLAFDGLRVRICPDPAGASVPDSVLFGLPLEASQEPTDSKTSGTSDNGEAECPHRLAAWSPLAQRLAESIAASLQAVWVGAADARQDAALLQPPAVRVGRDASKQYALSVAGRVPSLTIATLPVGRQVEELLGECGPPKPVRLDTAGATAVLAQRLGGGIPAGAAVAQLAFLLRIVESGRPHAAKCISTEIYQATGELFAAELLPIALGIRYRNEAAEEQCKNVEDQAILQTVELREAYARVIRDAPEYRVRLQAARENWRAYVATDAFRRAVHRLSRTLLPMDRKGAPGAETGIDYAMSTSSQGPTVSAVSVVATSLGHPAAPRIGLRDVIDTYAATAAHLRERRLFGLLAECLWELGHVHLLQRQRTEASCCWLEAADAALGVPESLRQPATTWPALPIAAVGLPRVFLAVLSLTSLAMFSCREQQHVAVDACLLAARVIERLLSHAGSATSGFPRRLRDYSSFMLCDLIVLPHLGDSGETLSRLMPRVIQHMLFLAGELLRCRMPLYAGMVAALTAYLARTHTRHVGIVVEAQLVQAVAAARYGSQRAAMHALRNVCSGARLPCAALDGTNIFMRPVVEYLDGHDGGGGAARGNKGGKKAPGAAPTMNSTPVTPVVSGVGSNWKGDDAGERGGISPLQDCEGLYCDAELPTAPANATCVSTFLSQCFRLSASPTIAAGSNIGIGTGFGEVGGLVDAVVARYGRNLSYRVEIATADALIALGARESAYTWTAHATPFSSGSFTEGSSRRGGGGGSSSAGGSGVRSRSALRVPLHSFSTSASIDALAAAEQIALGLLKRVGSAVAGAESAVAGAGSVGKGTRSARAAVASPVQPVASQAQASRDAEDAAVQKGRETQAAYVRGVAELLLARVHVARGEYTRALTLLQGLVTFMDTAGPATPVPGEPSFLWTLTTHTFVCETYELMAMCHLRLREYTAAQQVVQEALVICQYCSDPYAARVFSLYDAAIAARRGDLPEAREKIEALRVKSGALATDARIDWTHAWIILAGEALRRTVHSCAKNGGNRSKGNTSTNTNNGNKDNLDSTDGLESAVSTLRVYCEANGLPPASRLLRKPPPRPLTAWCVEIILLHHSVNFLAAEHMRLGRPHRAVERLRDAITGLTTQYDTLAHPTPLLESQLLLARALCQMNPSLLTHPQQQQLSPTGGDTPVSEENVILALDERRREPVELLFNVARQVVESGTHDYDALRLALLLLAVLLARAGRGFHVMAATCTLLARLVEDMKLHVFSATSVFGLYGDESIVLGVDVSFSETVIAAIQSTQRGLGHTAERGPARAAASHQQQHTSPEPKRGSPHFAREKATPRPSASLSTIVGAFAALHRERALQEAAPPLESLDLETALRHVRAFLQQRSAPPCFTYQWYPDSVREAHLRQQQSQSGGRYGASRMGASVASSASASTMGEASVSLLPPIVLDALPSPLEASTLHLLGIPRANTVVCQSFARDAPVETPGVIFVLFLSPVYDPAATQPPPLGDRVLHAGRKAARERGGEKGGGGEKGTASRSAAPAGTGASSASLFADGLHGGEWEATQCVVFELPLDEVLTLRAHAERALKLMQSPPADADAAPDAAAGAELSVSAALAQQLGDAFALLAAKSAAGGGGGGGRRAGGAPRGGGPLAGGDFAAGAGAGGSGATAGSALSPGAAAPLPLDEGAAAAAPAALDEAKSQLALGLVEALVRAVVPRVVADDELMERCVQGLLPRCPVSIDVVRFMRSMLVQDGGAASMFNPGMYEWFARMVEFTAKHT